MSAVDPGWLDTIGFAGASRAEIERHALGSRPGLRWFEHPTSLVRMRVPEGVGIKPIGVFLPDGPASIESYDAVIAALSDAYDVVVIEIPGFGYSWPLTPAALSFDGCVAATAAALAALALPPVILVGPCVQGLVALALAKRHPELVAALIVAQTGDWAAEVAWGPALDPKGVLKVPLAGQIGFRLTCEHAAVDWWAAFAAGPDFDVAALQAEARTLVRHHCAYALASITQKWFGGDPPDLAVTLPVTAIWGLADRSHAATDRASILTCAPHARIVEVVRAGHFADLEAIATVRAELDRLTA
jgi:pimeloyl-ACP methyl ester carboxylesterase